MKQKLLLFLGALMMTTAIWGAAPASYVSFSVNGTTPYVGFDKFATAVPEPYNLGVVYKMLGEDRPNLGVTGYQVVIGTDREGIEYEDRHYMLAYIGVYDESISLNGAYYDRNEEGLFLLPHNAHAPVPFGHQFYGGTGSAEPMNGNMTADQFLWSDGMLDDFVLPKPLVYDEATNSCKEGEYQQGHSYVIAIKFREVTHMTMGDEDMGWQPGWLYPWPWEPTEYTSWYWDDYAKECLRARFTYAADEAVTTASVTMTVNGEQKQYNLLGENQDPIDLGTIYKKEVTGDHGDQWTLPDLGFESFIVESAVPYNYSNAAGVYGASMTFTTLPKSEADQIGEGFKVDNNDYKTGNFGRINDDLVPAILCGTEEGLAKLSEDWAYIASPMDVWGNWMYSGTHPVWAGWPLDGAFEDGQTYTVALYFTEYNANLQPIFTHRNGGRYYKFNFTYKENSQEQNGDEEPQDMLHTPLTLEAVTSGTITFNLNLSYGTDPSVMNAIEYRKNGGEWATYTWGDAIAVVEGDKVAFRGDNVKYYGNGTPSYNSHIASTADVYVYGNMMSLIHASDFATNYTLTEDWNFANLFKLPTDSPWEPPVAVTTIKSHPSKDIVLPATTLTNYCYAGLFAGCKGITRAPELPAKIMTVGCYTQMFRGTGLTEAPALPATDMIPYSYDDEGEHGSIDCYMQMFQECTELTVAPVLPATTLVHGVYQNMFEGCTSLTTAPVLPATDLTGGDQCYTAMFKGCTSLVTAPALPATTLDSWCYMEMFSGCTSLENAPELPATVLAEDCYHRMFEGCASLQKAPVLPAPKLLGQVYGGMFDGCTSLNYVKCLAVDIVDTSHGEDATTDCWLANVAATGTFVKADAADWSVKTKTGEALNGIPAGWKVYNESDETGDDVPGDASGDGVVDTVDLVEIVNALAGKASGQYKEAAADLNGDNTVNIADVILLVNKILGE